MVISMPLCIQAQNSTTNLKNQENPIKKATIIGFHTRYSNYSGLTKEISLTHELSQNQALRFSIGTNFDSYLDIAIGWKTKLIEKGRFEFSSGVDLKLALYNGNPTKYNYGTELTFEIPLYFKYRISKHFELNAEIDVPFKKFFNRSNPHFSCSDYKYSNTVKIGVGYKF